MSTIAYLRPRSSHAGTERLLADIEQAVAIGAELGDRRTVIRELTVDLHCNHARLQSAIAELRAWGADRDPETARRIRLGEELCDDLLSRLGPLLQQADHLIALLTVRDGSEPDLMATQ